MKDENIDAYIIPSSDAHDNEYTAECDKRRQYVSGFTGSTGDALVTMNNAFIYTDSRYQLQAKHETNSSEWTIFKYPRIYHHGFNWISKEFNQSSKYPVIGVDPLTITYDRWKNSTIVFHMSHQLRVVVAGSEWHVLLSNKLHKQSLGTLNLQLLQFLSFSHKLRCTTKLLKCPGLCRASCHMIYTEEVVVDVVIAPSW